MKLFRYVVLMSALTLPASFLSAQQTGTALPLVVQHAEPSYPLLARQARISGDVRVTFTTDGEAVIGATADTGHPLLRGAAEENINTWKFAPHQAGTFSVTFHYGIQTDPAHVVFPAHARIQGDAHPTKRESGAHNLHRQNQRGPNHG